ncbi:MAG: glyoxalase [Paracoccaceae bacterium]|nr:MAG: glyoxalase [Paracoccaceae bacterium]
MDYETAPAPVFGRSLTGITLNLLVPDAALHAGFLARVFGMTVHRASRDFAIVLHAGQPLQLHADATFAAHPLHALLPEAGPRGAGAELRLHEADPDAACARAASEPGAMVLDAPRDKAAHGLREAVILCPAGYAWVPSRRL